MHQASNFLNAPRNLHRKLLAERPRSTFILQRNLNFGETLDQEVLFSCRRLRWKATKYDAHIFGLTVPVYKLFERSS